MRRAMCGRGRRGREKQATEAAARVVRACILWRPSMSALTDFSSGSICSGPKTVRARTRSPAGIVRAGNSRPRINDV